MAAVYGIEIHEVVALADCPTCRMEKGFPCVSRGGAAPRNRSGSEKGKPVSTVHPLRVYEAKRARELAKPYLDEDRYTDGIRLEQAQASVSVSRWLDQRELAEMVRSASGNKRWTAVKVNKHDLLAMIAEIATGRQKRQAGS